MSMNQTIKYVWPHYFKTQVIIYWWSYKHGGEHIYPFKGWYKILCSWWETMKLQNLVLGLNKIYMGFHAKKICLKDINLFKLCQVWEGGLQNPPNVWWAPIYPTSPPINNDLPKEQFIIVNICMSIPRYCLKHTKHILGELISSWDFGHLKFYLWN